MRIVLKRAGAFFLAFFLLLTFYVDICAMDIESGESAAERLRRGFESFAEEIDLSEFNIAPEELGKVFSDATKNSPYLFYVDRQLSYTYKKGGCVVSVKPKYTATKEDAMEMAEFCRAEIKKLASFARVGDSELERVRVAHDLICTRFSYDLTLESNNMYSFLKSGRGTCQGYTWTYMALLRELGLECEYAASDAIAHIWLKVKINGEWYHSDVTWDDPPSGEGSGESVSRRHFLFSDKKADADGYRERYGAREIACTSEKYDGEIGLVSCDTLGDTNHGGEVGLYDLLALRMFIEQGRRLGYFCPICADVDGDGALGAGDVDALRARLLTNGVG